MVDDYEMMDGFKFDWNNVDYVVDLYVNRDFCFYMIIMYDGVDWKLRFFDVVNFDFVD